MPRIRDLPHASLASHNITPPNVEYFDMASRAAAPSASAETYPWPAALGAAGAPINILGVLKGKVVRAQVSQVAKLKDCGAQGE